MRHEILQRRSVCGKAIALLCQSTGCGVADANEPDSAWEEAADEMRECIRGKLPDLSDKDIDKKFKITADNLEIRWETVDNDEGAVFHVVGTRNSAGEFTSASAYIVGLDYNKLHDMTTGRYRSSRDHVLHERICHEYVHIWKFAKSKGKLTWSGHGGAFHRKFDSFKARSRSCK